MSGALLVDSNGNPNVPLAHGVPYLVANPLPNYATPLGVQVFNCDSQLNPSVTVSKTALVNGVLATAPKDKLFLTALYPLAEQYGSLTTSAAQSVATAANTVMVLPNTIDSGSRGTHIVADGIGHLKVTVAGLYDVRAKVVWASNATGIRVAELQDQTGNFFGTQSSPGYGAQATFLGLSAIAYMTAGDIFQVVLYQDSGASLSTAPSANNSCSMQLRQLSNDASLTANCTLFMVGA